MPHTALRRCRVCRTQMPKSALMRWTIADGSIREDPKQISPGRGYYTCSKRCAEILPKTIKNHKKV
ncbi:MAG TPA: DUF448 domain-containing protein [Candidatus Saccharimonadia bacterium]|nr:DUF448 domain-containing protein [Candidatus Saccharimonadia bacterium]